MGKNVKSIGAGAFRGNKLISITIPDSVTFIGDDAFRDNQLTSVTLGKSVTNIEYNAFSGNKLTSIIIPDSVTRIYRDAFEGCPLTSITLGRGLTFIGTTAFEGNQLTSIVITKDVPPTDALYSAGITTDARFEQGHFDIVCQNVQCLHQYGNNTPAAPVTSSPRGNGLMRNEQINNHVYHDNDFYIGQMSCG